MQTNMKPLRTAGEQSVGKDIEAAWSSSRMPIEARLENFPIFVRRKSVTRFLALYEVFKQVLDVKGSIVECGVHAGFGLMSWAKFSAVLEPNNLTRRIYGFDTFEGFPSVHEKDVGQFATPERGDLRADAHAELTELARIYDVDRFLGHIPKVHLVRGDATQTIPKFIEENKHLVVSLLYLDFDLYEPTKVALEHFVPRMPKGSIIAFDELDNPIWPGETLALLDTLGIGRLEIRRLPFDPYIGYAILR